MPVLDNAKHEAVAQSYVADRRKIGWKAYQKVYPRASKRGAETGFSRLMDDNGFAARVAELQQAAAEAPGGAVMTAREVLAELSRIGRSNVADALRALHNCDSVEEAIEQLTPAQQAAIAEVTVEQLVGADAKPVRRVKFKLHSKTTALDLLGRHYRLFADRHVHEDPDGRAGGTGAAEKMSDLEVARRIAFVLSRGLDAAGK